MTYDEIVNQAAIAMQARREELIALPLWRIWRDLAKIAIQAAIDNGYELPYDPTQQGDTEDDL